MKKNETYDEKDVIRNKDTGEIQWIYKDAIEDEEKNNSTKLDYNDPRVKRAFGNIEKRKSSIHSIQNSNGKVPYMAQENVRAFNKVMFNKVLKGRPQRWDSLEELQSELRGYFELCDETAVIPTVTGVAAWLGCSRDTLYSHANNPNSIFSDTIKRVMSICHFSLENGAVDGKVNSVLYMFLGKNYFGLKDDKNITVTPATSNSTNSQETMDAIQKQIEEENVPNADYQED